MFFLLLFFVLSSARARRRGEREREKEKQRKEKRPSNGKINARQRKERAASLFLLCKQSIARRLSPVKSELSDHSRTID